MLSIFLYTLRTDVHCWSLTLHLGYVVTRSLSRLLWRRSVFIGRCTRRAGVHCRSRRLSRLLWGRSVFVGRCTRRAGVHCRSRRLSRLLWGRSVFVGRCTRRAGVYCRSLTLYLGRVATRVGSHACSGGGRGICIAR